MIEVICREVWRISFIDSIGGSLLAITSIYGIISFGATSVREAGQGRNPAALSEVNCVLFSIALDESSPKDVDES